MSSPTVTCEDGTYTFTLFRTESPGDLSLKEEKWVFTNHHISVYGFYNYQLEDGEREKVKGPFSADGRLYYILAEPLDGSKAVYIWLENGEHAAALRHKMWILQRQADGW